MNIQFTAPNGTVFRPADNEGMIEVGTAISNCALIPMTDLLAFAQYIESISLGEMETIGQQFRRNFIPKPKQS